MVEDFLQPKQRAEDILLGSLGYSEEASIVNVEKTESGYKGIGVWKDGVTFTFKSEGPLSSLEEWALSILTSGTNNRNKAAA
ncbi:MAG: hypothetical protein D6780_06520 [Candidatus Dadabacteria bacterium]|nr:MAG: hypothetical protein D6780_06520 [Candidatus Dadabacteria bacterium]